MRGVLGALVVAVVVTLVHAELKHTVAFNTHLSTLITDGNNLKTCLHKVTHPLGETSQFAADVAKIDSLMTHLEHRVEAMVDVITGVMAIPFVGQAASVVLMPAKTVLNTVDQGLKTVTHTVHKIVATIKSWLKPLAVVQQEVAKVETVIGQITRAIGLAQSETTKIISCLTALPASKAKNHVESAVETVAHGLDHVPHAVMHPVHVAADGCHKVENFMAKLHLVRRKKRAIHLPSLHKVVDVLQKIDQGMGPVGKFLDKVHDALHKKICLVGDLVKIGKEVVSKVGEVGKELVSGAEHVGKEVVKGVEHVGHSISHAIHHVFGRSAVDGRYYVIVDEDFVHSNKRGLDVCVSIHQALKAVNGVTKGMLSEAKKFIGKLFHGHSPFHIPGLNSDFLNLGNVLKHFNIPMPKVASLLKLGGQAVTHALHLDPVAAYTKAAPVCKAALTG